MKGNCLLRNFVYAVFSKEKEKNESKNNRDIYVVQHDYIAHIKKIIIIIINLKKKKKKPNPLMHEATKLETNITFLLK